MAPKLLLVDDVSEVLDIMEQIFEQAGAKVTTATNGEEALNMLRVAEKMDEQFDMLVLDIRMPKMNGNKLAETARADGYSGPIIAMTANYTVSGGAESKSAGINAYFSKETLNLNLAKALISEHCGTKSS